MPQNLNIKTKLMLVVVGGICLVVSAFYINNEISLRNLFNTETSDDAVEVSQVFSNIQADEQELLAVSLDVLEGDQEARKIFIKKDREVFYSYMKSIFENLKNRYHVDTLEFYLPDGTNFLRVQDKTKYGDKGEHGLLFKEVMSTGKEVSGFDVEDQDLAFRLIRPYKNQNEIIGYIEIGESMNHLLTELQRGTDANFSVYVNKNTLSENNLSELKQKAGAESFLETASYIEISTTNNNKLTKECFSDQVADFIQTKGPKLIKEMQDGGKDYSCAGFSIPWSLGQNTAIIISVADISRFTSVINNNRLVFIGSAVILFILSFIFINYLTEKVFSNPLTKLNEATQQIAEGNLNQRVEIKSNDEIGQLAVSFNDMTDKLRKAYENLEEKIKQRTLDLEEKTNQLEIKNKDADERGTAVLNILEDLDKEKNDLERLNAKEEAYLKSIGEGLVVTDQEGKLILANEEATRLIGLTMNQIKGKVWAKEVPIVEDESGKIVPYEKTSVYGALHNQKTLTTKFFYNLGNGRRFPVLVTAASVVIDNKNQGAVIVFRDITKEEEIDKAKSEFISLASHQLRTPLSAIKWFVELLNDTKMTREQTEFMKNISGSTERMIELVNALLNISRIESGRITVNPQLTDLAKLVREITANMQQNIDAKKLQLSVAADSNLPEVSVDQKMIRVVYENLLTNAIKYTPAGGKISVSIKKQGLEIISKVVDTGLGIPRKDYSRIFDKFYRGDNAVKAEPGGTGLGLYLTKAIIDSSKGKIGFASTEGKGTTFWFSLPLTGTPAKKGDTSLT